MARLGTSNRKAAAVVRACPATATATATAAATTPCLPSPNPFPPGIVPFRPSSASPMQPSRAPTPQSGSEDYPGDAEFEELVSRVIEVVDPKDKNAPPKYVIMPEPAAQASPPTAPSMPAPTQPTPALPVWASMATTAVMFDDASCPELDPSKGYWVSFNDTNPGVFDDNALLTAGIHGVKGADYHGPKSLDDAFETWKRGCLTGIVSASKPISSHSILPRIVQRPRQSIKLSPEVKARRDKIITDLFIKGMKEATEAVEVENNVASRAPTDIAAPTPATIPIASADDAMAVDSVGNIFQSGAMARPAKRTIASSVLGSTGIKNKMVASPSKAVKKKPNLFYRSHSRSSSMSSSVFSDNSAGSHTLSSDPSAIHTPVMNSPMLFSCTPSTSCGMPATFPNLFWVVHVGKVPGVYFSEETTIANAGSRHSRVTVYESFHEASLAYAAALRSREIVTVVDE